MSKLSSFNKTNKQFTGGSGNVGKSKTFAPTTRTMTTNVNASNITSNTPSINTNNGGNIPDPSANVTSLGGLKINHKHQGFGLQRGSNGLQPSSSTRRRGGLKTVSQSSPPPPQLDISNVSFPIDLVYTWVDGSDEEWIRIRNKYLPTQSNIPEDSLSECRWRDLDELRYSIESAYTFAPWIRKIFIISDQQRPWWFEDSNPGKIVFVDHVELFGQDFEEFLPVFNSHSIETLLHRIPDLSEHFIYANDDCFFGNYVQPTDFFTPDGKFKIFLTADDLETEQSLKSFIQQSKKNNNPTFVKSGGKMNMVKNNQSSGNNNSSKSSSENLSILPYFTAQAKVNTTLDQVFGKSPISRKRLKHQMKPLRVSTFEKCWDNEIIQEYLFSTMSTRFRSLKDIDPVALVVHVGLMVNESVPGTISSKYYPFVDDFESIKKVFYHLLKFKPAPKIFCLNDDTKHPDEKLIEIIKEGLNKCLPHQKLNSVDNGNGNGNDDDEVSN
jgi:hypothetical protein